MGLFSAIRLTGKIRGVHLGYTMTTRFVGTKELRQRMARIARDAEEKNERIIVLRKNRPVFELRPLSSERALVESLRREIEKAREDKRAGRIKTQADVERLFGL